MTDHDVCYECLCLAKYKIFPGSITPDEARHLPRELQYCMVSGRLLTTEIKTQIADIGCMSRLPHLKPLCGDDNE
jgi:hypothetical protein